VCDWWCYDARVARGYRKNTFATPSYLALMIALITAYAGAQHLPH